MWLTILSDQLPVIALVSRYLANKLMGHGLLPEQQVPKDPHRLLPVTYGTGSLFGISWPFGQLSQSRG